jgi:hypothetical protein
MPKKEIMGDVDDEWDFLSIDRSEQWYMISDHIRVQSFDTYNFTYKDMRIMRREDFTIVEEREHQSYSFLPRNKGSRQRSY